MEKIFCDFCGIEITQSLISIIKHKTDLIHYDRKKTIIVSPDTMENEYDLCAECNQEFIDYIESKRT